MPPARSTRAGGGFVNLVQPFTNAAGARVNVNQGTFSAAFGGAQSGRIEIAAGATLNTDGSLTNAPGGVIGGSGTIELFGGTLTNAAAAPPLAAGVVRPGDDRGAGGPLRITNGSFTNNGTLDIRLGGQAENQFGHLQLATAGTTATLGGTLALSTAPGYAATEGDTFTLVAAPTSQAVSPTRRRTFALGHNVLQRPSFFLIGLGGPDVNSWILGYERKLGRRQPLEPRPRTERRRARLHRPADESRRSRFPSAASQPLRCAARKRCSSTARSGSRTTSSITPAADQSGRRAPGRRAPSRSAASRSTARSRARAA